MTVIKPVLENYYVKWLRPSFLRSAAALQCYSTHLFLNLDQFRRLLSFETHSDKIAAGSGYVVTDIANQVVGYILFRSHEIISKNLLPKIHFIDLVIHPDHRRKGLGALLVNRMKTKSMGCSCLLAPTKESNDLAHAFLKANQFVAYQVVPDFFEDQSAYCFIFSRNKFVVQEACQKVL